MDINAIGIPLTFLGLCAIGLWMIIFSKGFWALKTLFITFCLYFSFAMWFSLSDLSGWATSVSMPQKSIIHWVLVQEPSKFNKKDDGGIFVWATEADTENKVIEKIEDFPENTFGYVYRITNLTTGKEYIGKKQLESKTNVKC